MAIITQGIMGGFSGTVGTVVGSRWRGINIMRSRATYSKDRMHTPAQLDQQLKFGLVNRFTKTLSPLLTITHKRYAQRKTGCNSAVSYLLEHAVTGSSPAFELDYSKVLISRGPLMGAQEAAATADPDAMINFRWRDNSSVAGTKTSDRAIVVVYCPALQQSRYAITTATRSSEAVSLQALGFSGYTVHTWLGFIAENEKQIANSVYAGALVV
jgi:hypothetical protein